jgi:hypothetical protein
MTRSTRNVVVAVVLGIGLAVGLFLVVTGGDDGSTDATITTTTTAPDSPAGGPSGSREPLPLEDTSRAAVEELTGLAVPAEASEFLTARLDDGRQLDVTFVVPAAAVDGFVAGSGLPEPIADERVVLHSSPLWKLNPDEGSTLEGTSDEYGSVQRAVELVTQPDGSVRARIVITSAA